MNGKIGVLHICDEVGLGGTERGIIAMCRTMRYGLFRHAVYCFARAGERAKELAGEADLHVADGTGRQLASLLSDQDIRVVLIHRAGAAASRWSEAISTCRQAGIAVLVEINIFGLVDSSPEDEFIDWHLHISKSSYCHFIDRAFGAGYPRVSRHRVLYIPTEVARISAEVADRRAKSDLRRRLGLGSDDLVLLRTGRPDFRKWGDLLLDVIHEVGKRIPQARFVFLSAPATRAWYMGHRFPAGLVRVLPATGDDGELANAYSMADVYVHSSRRGESFGVSLVEAMAAGLPIVVDSTPWRDNAQIEVVDHMKTGLIANSAESFTAAIEYLHLNPALRAEMGRRGRDKALRVYDAEVVCRSLAGLVGETFRKKGVNHPGVEVLEGEVRPALEEIRRYAESEKAQREAASWDGVPARRLSSPLRRIAWGVVDILENAGRKSGLFKRSARRAKNG